eukprot:gene11236-21423_t
MDKRKQAKSNDVLHAEIYRVISRKCKLAKGKWWNNKWYKRLEAMNRHQETHDKIKEITGIKKKSKGSECNKDKEGNMLFNENDIKKRWQEYVSELFDDDRDDNYDIITNGEEAELSQK